MILIVSLKVVQRLCVELPTWLVLDADESALLRQGSSPWPSSDLETPNLHRHLICSWVKFSRPDLGSQQLSRDYLPATVSEGVGGNYGLAAGPRPRNERLFWFVQSN